MVFAKPQLLVALLLVTWVAAAPAPDPVFAHDPDWPPWGGNSSVPKRYDIGISKHTDKCNISRLKWSTNCKAQSTREEDTPVKVRVYEYLVMTSGERPNLKKSEERPIFPPIFTNLWDNVVPASCNDVQCSEIIGKATTPQHMGGIQGTLEMWLEGVFYDEETRDEFFAVLEQAFDKAVIREFSDNLYQMYEWGPRDLIVVRKANGSTDHLHLKLRTKQESEDGCGGILSRILELGGLCSPGFGLVSVVFATADI
jgi:hypothetical protein